MQSNPTPGALIISLILLIWTLSWKGIALWRAARYNQTYWFTALLVTTIFSLYALGLLDIIYLFRFAKKRMELKELKLWQYFKK